VTFLLTSGGHNAGIVSEPGTDRTYSVRTKAHDDQYTDPDSWLADATKKSGSWWAEWVAWLTAHSNGLTAPPSIGLPAPGHAPLGPAPGSYVKQS
jgi:polyhydroxyalkanoate synthase